MSTPSKLSNRVNDRVVWTSVRVTLSTAKPTATDSRPMLLAAFDRPRLRSCETLIQSSTAPTTPAPITRATSRTPESVNPSPGRVWATT